MRQTIIKTVFIAYCLALAAASLYPLPAPPVTDLPLDKIFHAFAYLLLAMLRGLSTRTSGVLKVFLFTVIFGCILEGIQYFLPFRSFDLTDIGCNIAGALVGSMIVYGRGLKKNI